MMISIGSLKYFFRVTLYRPHYIIHVAEEKFNTLRFRLVFLPWNAIFSIPHYFRYVLVITVWFISAFNVKPLQAPLAFYPYWPVGNFFVALGAHFFTLFAGVVNSGISIFSAFSYTLSKKFTEVTAKKMHMAKISFWTNKPSFLAIKMHLADGHI